MNKLYRITESHKDGTQVITERTSFNAYDALEEHFFEVEPDADEVIKISVEFVRQAH